MSLTKTISVDQITIEANGIVLYRELTRILENGAEISAAYHRISLAQGRTLRAYQLMLLLFVRLFGQRTLLTLI